MSMRRAFTMVELLTVIAIIAILTAILFPVFATVRARAQAAKCASNLHQIGQAVALYHDDWGRWPVTLDTVVVGNRGALPGLFPRYLKSEATFHCPTSVYRQEDAGIDWNDPANVGLLQPAWKAYATPGGPMTPPGAGWAVACQRPSGSIRAVAVQCQSYPNETALPLSYPKRDSYDGGFVGGSYQIHYDPDWTEELPNLNDSARQLKYREPPAATVVTWCANHAPQDASGVTGGMVNVLFRDGRVASLPGDRFNRWDLDGNTWRAR